MMEFGQLGIRIVNDSIRRPALPRLSVCGAHKNVLFGIFFGKHLVYSVREISFNGKGMIPHSQLSANFGLSGLFQQQLILQLY